MSDCATLTLAQALAHKGLTMPQEALPPALSSQSSAEPHAASAECRATALMASAVASDFAARTAAAGKAGGAQGSQPRRDDALQHAAGGGNAARAPGYVSRSERYKVRTAGLAVWQLAHGPSVPCHFTAPVHSHSWRARTDAGSHCHPTHHAQFIPPMYTLLQVHVKLHSHTAPEQQPAASADAFKAALTSRCT